MNWITGLFLEFLNVSFVSCKKQINFKKGMFRHASSKKKQVQKLKIKFNAAKASLNSENPIRVQ